MKIAYILADPGIGIFGTKGASVHAQEMIRAFRALGHTVTVFTTKRGNKYDDPRTEYIPRDLTDLPLFVVPVSGVKGAAAREHATLRAAQRMAALAAENRYDLIYERYSLFSAAGAALTEHMNQSGAAPRLVLEVNSPLLAEQSAHRMLHDAETAMNSTLLSFAAADVISCVSEPVAGWVRHLIAGAGAAAEENPGRPQVIVTPNGVNTERFACPGTAVPQERRFTIGFLGTLKPWHGTETLLEAFASVPDPTRETWHCQIIGDGPQRDQLQTLAIELGIGGQVDFCGTVAPEQVPAALSGWDVGVAPYPASQDSSGHYFSPMKIYEYMAAGLPVLASAVGEIPQVIQHCRTGVLVPGSDPDALSAALVGLADAPTARRQMGSTARAEAYAQHSWESRAAAVLGAAKVSASEPAAMRQGVR